MNDLFKQIGCFLFFFFLMGSCDQNHPSESTVQESNVKLTGPKKYYTIFSDTACINQIEKAKSDVAKNKLVYKIHMADFPRYEEEFEQLLQQHQIEYISHGPNCMITQECYGHYMDSIIRQRKGEHFFKELSQEADRLFLAQWNTKIYDYWDLDQKPTHPEGEIASYVRRQLQFPKTWEAKPQKFKRQYLSFKLQINQQGQIVKTTLNDNYFLNPNNEKHLPLLEKNIQQIISKLKDWNPAQLEDHEVSCNLWVDVGLD